MPEQNLLESLGGEAGCRRLAADFYARVSKSTELKPLFPGKSLRCATEEFAAFLIQFLDGDPKQTQYRWWLSLRESHARFQINPGQSAAWLGLMHQSLDLLIQDPEQRDALEEFFHAAAAYIVGHGEARINHLELEGRWHSQVQLDLLVDHLAAGRDTDAIDLADRFVARPSVFIGILARMMDAERDLLAKYVFDAIQNVPGLVDHQFNGRTLLHFAAGFACEPVVRMLLRLGMDPNIPDGGGHAPLYRAAGSRNAERGAATIGALIEAGARLDHSGGVSKSTALHEAARHGNLLIAKVLVLAGASIGVRDKRGLTPLERAKNCRRWEVAAFLASCA